jgi:transcriptional regulator with XRE-family HTH domain
MMAQCHYLIGGTPKMKNSMREVIEKKNLKIIDILDQTGLSKSYFYDVLNGTSVPSLINARKIAEALGTTITNIFKED